MNIQLAITSLLVLTAVSSYLNHRFLKLPASVGITFVTLVLSLSVMILNATALPFQHWFAPLVSLIGVNTNFINPEFFISVVCFLLFAGGLHICVIELAKQKTLVAILTTLGVLCSTLIIGGLVYAFSDYFAIPLSLPYCFVFGALISPTDPIAVLGMLKQAKAPNALSMRITGESLFNDGIGIVIFISILHVATGNEFEQDLLLQMLAQEILGGISVGLVLGIIGNTMLKKVHEFHVSLLITLAIVMVGYSLASSWHFSAPIALAITGLMIGFKLRSGGLSPVTAKALQSFWEMIDEVLNAILFVVIGLVVLQLKLAHGAVMLGLAAIPIVLIARFVSVAIPIKMFSRLYTYCPNVISIMTWGGLRGGVSVALALSLPPGPEKQIILSTTYAVVLFSILVQGMTIKPLITRSLRIAEERSLAQSPPP